MAGEKLDQKMNFFLTKKYIIYVGTFLLKGWEQIENKPKTEST